MTRDVKTASLLLIALLGGSLAACATNASYAGSAGTASATVASVPTDQATDEQFSSFCLRETGSRIVEMKNKRSGKTELRCVNAAGRSYSKADLDSTGGLTLSEALHRLDPTIH